MAAMLTMSATSTPRWRTWTGFAHAEQDRADRLGAGQAPDELVGGVGRLEVREDQDVRAPHGRPRVVRLEHLRHDREVRLHLAVHRQRRTRGLDELDRPLDLQRARVRVGAEVREGDHRHPRLDVEAAHGVGRQDAISASSSAVGSMLTVVSAKKKVRSFSMRM